MERLKLLMTKLPAFIVGNWLFYFIFLKNTILYEENYTVLDAIDSILVSISLVHFICFKKLYSITQTIFIKGMVSIIALTLIYPYINASVYYYFYIFILLLTLTSAYVNRSRQTRED